MNLGFDGRVAIITGFGRGLGATMAEMFTQEGARVVVADLDEAAAASVAGKLKEAGHEAIAARRDVTDAASVTNLIEPTLEAFGRVDILVNNAGGPRDRLIKDLAEEDWHAVVEVILKGTFLCARAVVSVMAERRHGRIINIASRAHHGNPGQANYAAAKAGLIGFTGSQAREQGPFKITVNCVAGIRRDRHGQGAAALREAENAHHSEHAAAAAWPPGRHRRGRRVPRIRPRPWITGETVHVTGDRFSN